MLLAPSPLLTAPANLFVSLAPSPVPQALAAMKTATSRRVYYDFADMLRTNPTGNVPYTPILVRVAGSWGCQVRMRCGICRSLDIC